MFAYAESVATRNTVLTSLREMAAEAHKSKPLVTISINGESSDQKFYTTSDRIDGEVTIVAPADTRFDEVCITFEGTSRTWMERFGGSAATSRRTTVSQTVSGTSPDIRIPFLTTTQFLRLVQPVDETTLPIPRVATKGKTYTFPFTFVIPDRLLPSACDHVVENSSVKDAHLHLPPSLGDRSVGDGKDDLAPDMTRITYAIRTRILRKREVDDKVTVLADISRKILVSPSFEVAPPVHIPEKSKDFVLRREKDLRRGILGRKLGRIAVFADQPQPLKDSPNSPYPASTSVTVSLTYVSNDPNSQPPALETLTAKLKTSTFFSTTRQTYIPTFSRSTPDPSVGNYTETFLLSSRCIAAAEWEKQPSTSKATYKATLLVPILPPKGKRLLPTFSSCFISRSYTLDLAVSIRTSSHSQTSLSLKLPLQVVSQDAGGEGVDVEEFFTPRLVGRMEEEQEEQLPRRMLTAPNTMPTALGYVLFAGVPTSIPEPVGISPGCG
ncbi:hypothetical protein K440DRAFT_636782 [Wilcoxina mikolae CBS 423.85]|nr:hypothetical protein K440DRAFT_636782 [Wilcoxina mikolae CBS 423.85]